MALRFARWEEEAMRRREVLGLLGATVLGAPFLAKAQSPRAGAARIVLIANTAFEADALMAVVGNDGARNHELEVPAEVAWPRAEPKTDSDIITRPRCLIGFKGQDLQATVEIWCLYDLMSKDRSKSDNKARASQAIASFGPNPDGVIAFGTGAFPSEMSNNGFVAVGGTMFIHDAAGGGSQWSWPGYMERLISSKTPASFYSGIATDQGLQQSIRDRMLRAPMNPAMWSGPWLMASADAVAISSVNIASPADYARVDREAVDGAKKARATRITSVETTHGVIRAQWPEASFIYITGIPNRMGHFPDEVDKYAQNFVAAHNAGVVASFVLPSFLKAILK
jgi:hypothetical protein